MQNLRRVVVPMLLIIAILILPRDRTGCTEVYKKDIIIGVDDSDNKFYAEIASDEAERERGLSGRSCINDNSGMLFEFNDLGYYGIWMKGMHFAIDIVWLDSNKTITHIEKSVAPDTYPHIFTPDKASRYVLELHDGITDVSELTVGAHLIW